MFLFDLQHVDGSFSVKPLKQKQIVRLYIFLFNYYRAVIFGLLLEEVTIP